MIRDVDQEHLVRDPSYQTEADQVRENRKIKHGTMTVAAGLM